MENSELQKYKEEFKKTWLDNNCPLSQLISMQILSMNPDGNYIKVNGVDIYQDIFPEEFNIITEQYYNIMEKLKKHFLENNKKRIDFNNDYLTC